jgi:hypothetical protein
MSQLDTETVLCGTYMTFGQAIDAFAKEKGMPLDSTVMFWDLFTWNLDSASKNGNLSQFSIDFLLNGTRHPARSSFHYQFTVPSDQMEWFAASTIQIRDSMRSTYLEKHDFTDETHEVIYNALLQFFNNYDSRFTEPESRILVYMWAVFLTTVLKDTTNDKINGVQRRESAFFWLGMFACQWMVRAPFGDKTT